ENVVSILRITLTYYMVLFVDFQKYVVHTFYLLFFFNDTATTEIYTLSLHDALPILLMPVIGTYNGYYLEVATQVGIFVALALGRSEEHTSELQSPYDLVCRLLLEKKKNTYSGATCF